MRAREFINEGQEYWDKLEPPYVTQARDKMRFPATAVDDYGRVIKPGDNIKPPPPKPIVFTNKPDPAAGYPGDWDKGYPTRITPKMIEPLSGGIRMGPNKVIPVWPPDEEFAQLKQQVNPNTGEVYYFRKPENPPSDEWLKKERQFNQDFTKQFKPNTLDKGKEVTWPSQRPKGYNMNNPLSQKYRT
jgi:hypothetical protein